LARLKKAELINMDRYFRAVNYLSAAQMYLLDNPLLRNRLVMTDLKKNIVGHWGTVPGQNFIYLHLNRIIKRDQLNMIYLSGPGHGGQVMVTNAYLDGTYSEVYPTITEDYDGIQKLCKQFSFPGGVSSHAAPETPGSINEGGELGYSLAHAFGAVLDNPTLIAACVIGDGEAETGPLAASWQLNKIINPEQDGIVLPILHLNGYKIANPTILARMSTVELDQYFKGLCYKPYYVEGRSRNQMHKKMAKTLDDIMAYYKIIKQSTKQTDLHPVWPLIILRTPKGWTGPSNIVDSFKAHQVPIVVNNDDTKLAAVEKWLRSYHPEELFDHNGTLLPEIKALTPQGKLRMAANPNANGGLLLKELVVPNFIKYGLNIKKPGSIMASDMMELGNYLRDVITLNPHNFRIFGPDEALSNRLNHIFEVTNRQWNAKIIEQDEFLSPQGRVIDSILSEHLCEGLLEGYLLTGRHGLFHSYEAFIRIVDSMTSQHAKWLKVCQDLPWRSEIASLNYILTSNVWQQDQNGFTHQDPGFLNHLVTKKADIVRAYLPYDANSLISCTDHCLKTKGYINVIIASKHPRPQWLNMEQTIEHCTNGIGVWPWASTFAGEKPDAVLACCGDTPTLEVLGAISLIKEWCPKLRVRVVNIVDLMKLQSNTTHPHGLKDKEYNDIFTLNKHIIFAFHGYPNLIHQLTYKRANSNLHVHGYNEEGTITTAFDMRVQNKIDRYHLVLDVIKYTANNTSAEALKLKEYCERQLVRHDDYIRRYGIDMDEIKDWQWH